MKKFFNVKNRMKVLLIMALVVICLFGGVLAVFADSAPKGNTYTIVQTGYTRDSLVFKQTSGRSYAGIYGNGISSVNTVYAKMVYLNMEAVSSTVTLTNSKTYASSNYLETTTNRIYMSAKLRAGSGSKEILFGYSVTP